MVIDILFLIMMILAIVKGWSKGFIVGIFSLIALIVGLAAAIRLSTEVGTYFETQTGSPSVLWPIAAFVAIFIGVAFVVKLLAKLLQSMLKIVMLGWLNRIVGILFYIFAYAIIFSVILWVADQIELIPYSAKKSSIVFDRIAQLGPQAIDDILGWIPWFKDTFHQLKVFFGNISPVD